MLNRAWSAQPVRVCIADASGVESDVNFSAACKCAFFFLITCEWGQLNSPPPPSFVTFRSNVQTFESPLKYRLHDSACCKKSRHFQTLVLPNFTRAITAVHAHLSCSTTLDKKKKEPLSRFAARRTLFHVWYYAQSGAISAGQVRSATVRDFCPALIAPDWAWCHTWNSVLLAANLDDGSCFCPG